MSAIKDQWVSYRSNTIPIQGRGAEYASLSELEKSPSKDGLPIVVVVSVVVIVVVAP